MLSRAAHPAMRAGAAATKRCGFPTSQSKLATLNSQLPSTAVFGQKRWGGGTARWENGELVYGDRSGMYPDGTRMNHDEINVNEFWHDGDPTQWWPKVDVFTDKNGKKWVRGKEYTVTNMAKIQSYPDRHGPETALQHLPMWRRDRMKCWSNHQFLMRMEYLFFYVPTFIVFGLICPAFVMIYALEEAVASDMTVKIVGRQWYWIYEIQSPTDDEDEGEDDDD